MVIHSVDQLLAHPMYGHIWEAFIVEQIISNMQSELQSVQFYHYRTQDQAEIGLVLEGRLGIIPIEIKSGVRTRPKQLVNLSRFIDDYNCPFGLVINQSESVEWLSRGILQIPAGAL